MIILIKYANKEEEVLCKVVQIPWVDLVSLNERYIKIIDITVLH